jgi:hypothetical protein
MQPRASHHAAECPSMSSTALLVPVQTTHTHTRTPSHTCRSTHCSTHRHAHTSSPALRVHSPPPLPRALHTPRTRTHPHARTHTHAHTHIHTKHRRTCSLTHPHALPAAGARPRVWARHGVQATQRPRPETARGRPLLPWGPALQRRARVPWGGHGPRVGPGRHPGVPVPVRPEGHLQAAPCAGGDSGGRRRLGQRALTARCRPWPLPCLCCSCSFL